MSRVSAIAYGQLEESTKEKVIFRREYDPYTKSWGYLAGFPEDKVNKGMIGVLDFRIYEDGTVVRGLYCEAAKNYFTKLKLVHKETDEAKMCLQALCKIEPNGKYYVGEKITRKDRCY